MRIVVREERVGEWLETAGPHSPVSWERVVEHWLPLHAASGAPALTERNLEHLRLVVAGGTWAVATACHRFLLLHVGLWDGWPYWRPRVEACILGPLQSAEARALGEVQNVLRVVRDRDTYEGFRAVSG